MIGHLMPMKIRKEIYIMADENKVIEEQEFENINSVEVIEKKEGLLCRAKSTVKKAWNSKPGKVVKTIGLVAIGAVGALALSKGSSNADVIDPEDLNDILENSNDIEVAEF